jgi:O-antigen/teichoic acid export membrane protein
MNRLRRRRYGDGWADQVNVGRAVVLTVLSSVAAACVGIMLLGVLPRAWAEGDVLTAVIAVLTVPFNAYHAVQLGLQALAEVRRS